eukprot:498621-Rhodomonas_salina.1
MSSTALAHVGAPTNSPVGAVLSYRMVLPALASRSTSSRKLPHGEMHVIAARDLSYPARDASSPARDPSSPARELLSVARDSTCVLVSLHVSSRDVTPYLLT